ncbi:transcription-repair coupling factor, partial [Streptomyces sp. SID7499]|nr:transcription-repair coupling factor [Streptomyces sp. SID7499]
EAPIDVGAASLWGIADVRDRARELNMMWWSISPFAADAADHDDDTVQLSMHAPEAYRGDTARALADTKGWLADGWRTVYVTEGQGLAARTVEVLSGEGIAARLDADLTEVTPSLVHVSCGAIDQGFVDPALKLAVLTETDLTGQRTATKDLGRMPARRRKTIDPLTLEVGDYIVHEQHG